jgi:protein-tyrosine kinase
MERIKDAIELAKARGASLGDKGTVPRTIAPETIAVPDKAQPQVASATLNDKHLESHRIVAHKSGNPAVAAFDVLRTNILQEMLGRGWQTLVVTSPTPGCGKTVTAINLALSMARMPNQHVVLLDLDLRRPALGQYLGVKQGAGVAEVLEGKLSPHEAMFHLNISNNHLTVITNSAPLLNPAEAISSSNMASFLNALKNSPNKPIVIIDTPPLLASDDVRALLPQVDCVILTIAEGLSTASNVTACERLLENVNYLGVVLTKSQEKNNAQYY